MMGQGLLAHASHGAGTHAARVLVFSVDDGLFSVHLDWVEAVYPRAAVAVHSLKAEGGRSRAFLFHGDEPAPVVDLREAFDLQDTLGTAARGDFLVVRSGSILLALPVDGCVGVRDLDLRTQIPVPTRLQRDGGLPVGHIVELDGKMMVVLDPNRLLEGGAREVLVSLYRKGQLFRERQLKTESVWAEICHHPTVANVRAYARLCGRTGRARTASVAREVLKAMAASPNDGEAQAPLLAEIIRRARERQSGELAVTLEGDAEPGSLIMSAGRIVDALHGGERGQAAVKRLLAGRPLSSEWRDVDTSAATERITESTVAVAITMLDALAGERRGRRGR
jgi:hypothetical protein